MKMISDEVLRCRRCGYGWRPRTVLPASCPRCKQYLDPEPSSERTIASPSVNGLREDIRRLEAGEIHSGVIHERILDRLIQNSIITPEEVQEMYDSAEEEYQEELRRLEREDAQRRPGPSS
jgi:predicted Zn-ribbon and HTH transcriptional regulator